VRWCVIQHPELGGAVVSEASLVVHTARGWAVTSPLVEDQYALRAADYPLNAEAEVAGIQAAIDDLNSRIGEIQQTDGTGPGTEAAPERPTDQPTDQLSDQSSDEPTADEQTEV
jgi:hypothetical protein